MTTGEESNFFNQSLTSKVFSGILLDTDRLTATVDDISSNEQSGFREEDLA